MIRAFCLLFAASLLSGCGSQKIAAVVNGQVITVREVQDRMERLNPSVRAALSNDPKRLVDEMVLETVLIQEARRRGLEQDAEVRQLMKEAKRQILVGRLLEQVREGLQVQADEATVSAFYKENKEKFVQPETFRASHILTETEEAAKQALSRVNGGEPFEQVAQELSKDPSGSRGGDIGAFTRGQLIPEFEEAAARLKPGGISPVVRTQLGFHVIKLTDRQPKRELPFEEVKEQIRQQLTSQQQQQNVESFVQQLKTKSQIQVRESAVSTPSQSQSSNP